MTRKIKKTMNEKTKRSSGDKNTLILYMKDINPIPLLSREEEEKTAAEAAMGNQAARDKLVSANLRFVIKIAKKFQGRGVPLEDLISEGNIGLMHAIDGFDVSRGFHFISYAVWWIRHYIQKAVSEKARMIRLPQNKIDDLIRIAGARKEIKDTQTENAEIEEIARYLKMGNAEIYELLKLNQAPLYLGNPVFAEENSHSVGEFIEDTGTQKPEEHAMERIMKLDIEKVLSGLIKRDADIIRARYGLGNKGEMSLEEIGTRYKISKEGVRQIEIKVIQWMQEPSRRRVLEPYVA